MSLLSRFLEFTNKENLLLQNRQYLLAFSGGVDSVVMAELLHQSGFRFSIAHVNFSLRGNESDEDQLFAEETAKRHKVPFHTIRFETSRMASDQKKGIQETARELRYNWFNEVAKNNNFHAIITAHHIDDNIETVWMNLIRGTGLQGLTGMSTKQGGVYSNIIRPLLFTSKKEIIAFAQQNQLKWREDSSNANSDYTRNLIRNEVLPIIHHSFPDASINMAHNIERFGDINNLFHYLTNKFLAKYLLVKGEELHIPVLKIIKTPGYASLMHHILIKYSFSAHQIQEAITLLHAETGKFIQNTTYRIIRNRAWLIVSPVTKSDTMVLVIESTDTIVKTDSFEISIEWVDKNIPISKMPQIATINASELQFPLLVRKWKKGDYFYPFGMNKKKKLSDFFINQKLSLIDKEKIWVLESAGRIVWVIGLRIDNRFRVNDSTQKVARLTFTKN